MAEAARRFKSGRTRAFSDPAVAALFDSHRPPVKATLMRLRTLILETADATEGVGRVEETLKWGQPSYLTPETKSGSTIRIDALPDGSGCALYFTCHTNLVERFRELYPNVLKYEGNRAVLVDAEGDFPTEELRHCIAIALTYHRDNKRAKRLAKGR